MSGTPMDPTTHAKMWALLLAAQHLEEEARRRWRTRRSPRRLALEELAEGMRDEVFRLYHVHYHGTNGGPSPCCKKPMLVGQELEPRVIVWCCACGATLRSEHERQVLRASGQQRERRAAPAAEQAPLPGLSEDGR